MVITINTQSFLILVLTLLWANISGAQVQRINKDSSTLDISVSTVLTDNLNPTLVTEQQALGVIIAPKGQLVTEGHASQFLIDYSASFERYKLRDEDVILESSESFDDYRVRLLNRVFVANAWHVDTQVQYFNQQQKFGTGISQLRTDVLKSDQLKQLSGAVSLVYGNDTTSRFVSLKIHGSRDDYEENNAYSALFNTINRGVELNLAFRQSTATRFLFRLSSLRESYESESREDSVVYRSMVGFGWSPSGKASLEVLVGGYSRDNETNTSSGLSWSVNYSIEPTESWVFALSSARFTDVSQSELTTDSVAQNINVNAQYRYSEQWQFGVEMKIENTEFNFSSQTSELDEESASVNVSLRLKEHSQVKLIVGIEDKYSSDDLIDYSQLEARLTWLLDF